jgi:hypothetical protein
VAPLFNLQDPIQLIGFAGMSEPGGLAFIPLFHPAAPDRSLVIRARLSRDLIPPEFRAKYVQANGETPPTHVETGRLLARIPSDVARNMRADVSDRDVVYMVIVRRDVYDRAESGIVTPAGHSRLVIP